MKSKTLYFIELFCLAALPIFGTYFYSTYLVYRPIIYFLGGFYVLWTTYYGAASWSDIGFNRNHFLKSLIALLPVSIIIPVVTFFVLSIANPTWIYLLVGTEPIKIGLGYRIFLYAVLSVPIQELIYRGYLTWRLKQVKLHSVFINLISVLAFTLAHLPFQSLIMLAVTFVMGITYLKNYLKYKNIYTVILAHAFTGVLLILIRNFYLPY